MPKGNVRSSPRKRWDVRKWSSRVILDEEFSADSQVILAKQLLSEKHGNSKCADSHFEPLSDSEDSAQQAVYWLIKASKKGHPEATLLLKECVKCSKGITEHNFSDVKYCLQTSEEEKRIVAITTDLFNIMSEGDDFITINQLREALAVARGTMIGLPEAAYSDMKARILLGAVASHFSRKSWEKRLAERDRKLTKQDFRQAASSYSRGEIPNIGQSLIPRQEFPIVSLDFVFDNLQHPLKFSYWFYCLLTNILNLRTIILLLSSLPIYLKILLSMLLVVLVGHGPLTWTSSLYYSTLLVMVSASCHILCHKREFQTFHTWTALFVLYSEGTFVPHNSELKYFKRILPPFLCYIVSLLVHLAVQSYSNFIPPYQSEVTFIAILFSFLILCSFTLAGPGYSTTTSSVDVPGLLSFVLYVIAKYPYTLDVINAFDWEFFEFRISTVVSYLVGDTIEFCLNLRVLCYLMIPAILLKMAARNNWSGLYTDLVPHLLMLSWCHIGLLYFQGATWCGFLRSSLVFSALMLLLPVMCLSTVLLPLYIAVLYYETYEEYFNVCFSVFVALCIPALIMYWKRKRNAALKYVTLLQLTACILTGVVFVYHNLSETTLFDIGTPMEKVDLTFRDFVVHCNPAQFVIRDQAAYSKMEGLPVQWKGHVKSVHISKISNMPATITNMLPEILASRIRCVLGTSHEVCQEEDNMCKVLSSVCHLTNWNRYEFTVYVNMNDNTAGLWSPGSSKQVELIADHSFYNTSKLLSADDYVLFSGHLLADSNGIISCSQPQVKLSSLSCITCKNTVPSYPVKRFEKMFSDITNYVKYLLNLLFNPVIIFK